MRAKSADKNTFKALFYYLDPNFKQKVGKCTFPPTTHRKIGAWSFIIWKLRGQPTTSILTGMYTGSIPSIWNRQSIMKKFLYCDKETCRPCHSLYTGSIPSIWKRQDLIKKVLYCGKETCSLFHSFVSLHLFCIYFFVIKVLQFDSLFFFFFDLPYNADCTGVVLCMYSRIHTTLIFHVALRHKKQQQ